MALERLFDTIEAAREGASWRAAFGEPVQAGDQTVIPVAQVGYSLGGGFGKGKPPAVKEAGPTSPVESEGGGGGGYVRARPLGAFIVTPERVYFEPAVDVGKIRLLRFVVLTLLIIQAAATARAVLTRR